MRRRVLLLAVSLLTLLPSDALARAGGGSRSFSRPGFGGGRSGRGFGGNRGFGGGGHHFFFFGGGGGGGGGILLIIILVGVALFFLSRRARGRRS